jgi:hypothetical protein
MMEGEVANEEEFKFKSTLFDYAGIARVTSCAGCTNAPIV